MSQTLNGKTGVLSDKSAVAQTKKLKELLEQYFGPELASNDWCFVAMVHFNNFELKQPVCPTCSPFTIHGANQLATKLAGLETHLKAVRPQWSPSHQEYVALAQGLSFVVLAQPISTRCTITSEVHAKVVGKPETSSSKAKVGQGDDVGPAVCGVHISLIDRQDHLPEGEGKDLGNRQPK